MIGKMLAALQSLAFVRDLLAKPTHACVVCGLLLDQWTLGDRCHVHEDDTDGQP